MICRHCGKELEEGLTYCIFCGEPQEEGATRPVPEQKKSGGVLVPLLIVLALAAATAAALWLFVFKGAVQPQDGTKAPDETPGAAVQTQTGEPQTLPRVVVDESAYEQMARDFTQAILLRDLDTIGAKTHPQLKEPFVELFGKADFVFESCTLEAGQVRKIRRAEERAYESGLYEDYGLELTFDDAYEVVIPFTAVYHGKPYVGEMTVLVADIDGGRYVVQTTLSDMEEAFYEDNFAPGDHYFDTHSEE